MSAVDHVNDGHRASIAITGWAVLSPIGSGAAAFGEAVRAGRSGRRPLTPEERVRLPCAEACTVPDAEVYAPLGTRGARVFDRTTAMAVAATGLALRDAEVALDAERALHVGLVLGTSNASLASLVSYIRQTLVARKPYLVSPELFPNTVMNGPAGQCAIRHGLRALNTTVSGGRLAGILTLRYVVRMLRLGYAELLVAGGVEEFSPEMAWASHLAAKARLEVPPLLGEGCAMFVFEDPDRARAGGRKVRAEVLSCEAAFHAPVESGGAGRTLAACIRRALARAGVAPADVWAVSRRDSGLRELDAVEEEALAQALDGCSPARELRVGRLAGECFSASGALQLGALVAALTEEPDAPARLGLLTSAAHGGGVGCAVIRGA